MNITSEDSCRKFYPNNETLWCPLKYINSEQLCWPPAPPGEKVEQACPEHPSFDSNKTAFRICLQNGTWDYNDKVNLTLNGYTYFNNCILPHLLPWVNFCQRVTWDFCFQVANITRVIEMIGLSLSLISLFISLFIFYRYRILRNNRTKIHKNLFIATLFYVLLRLSIYVDQGLNHKLLNQQENLCIICFVMQEYAKTTMFMWMFIEGLYLHNIITVTVFQEHSYIKLYLFIGWGAPVVMTTIWVVAMILYDYHTWCWNFYYFLPYYWILEGPRCFIIIVNMLFLLNILRVLVVKLRQTQTSEIERLRKAVRAAIFLLPLMGTANLLFLYDPREGNPTSFEIWSYTTYFLTTFQGFFIAAFYCFLNGEVKMVLRNSFYVHIYHRYPTMSQHDTALTGYNSNQ